MRIVKWITTGAGIAAAGYAAHVARTWLRYGRPRPPRGAASDAFLDEVMPSYDVCERHAIHVAAPVKATLAAAKNLDLQGSRIVRAIFRSRELILRGRPDARPQPTALIDQMKAIGWGTLADTPNEIVMGAVTRPWEANPVFRPVAPADFAAFAEPGYVKIVWTLRADDAPEGGSTFRTETRAVATDPTSRARFRWYWAFLSPGIALIREAMLRPVAKAAERARAAPTAGAPAVIH